MDIANTRDRIWLNMHNTERMAKYFSRRSRQLEKKHNWLTFPLILIPALAIFVLQLEWQYKFEASSIILLIAAVLELTLLHFGSGQDVKAAKYMSNQSAKLSNDWKKLWIDQGRDNIVEWIEMLEGQTDQITSESVSYKEKLNEECFEEVEYEFAYKFGEQGA